MPFGSLSESHIYVPTVNWIGGGGGGDAAHRNATHVQRRLFPFAVAFLAFAFAKCLLAATQDVTTSNIDRYGPMCHYLYNNRPVTSAHTQHTHNCCCVFISEIWDFPLGFFFLFNIVYEFGVPPSTSFFLWRRRLYGFLTWCLPSIYFGL